MYNGEHNYDVCIYLLCSIPQLTKQHVQQGGAILSIWNMKNKGQRNRERNFNRPRKINKLNYGQGK